MSLLSNIKQPTSSETADAKRLTLELVTASLDSDTASTPHPTARHGSGDFFERGLISIEEADNLLHCYRNMSEQYLPYVLLADDIYVSQLRRDRPVLLQAILNVAPWKNRPLQLALEATLLEGLGKRFFVKGEKSLEILQTFLVYLAWCVSQLGNWMFV